MLMTSSKVFAFTVYVALALSPIVVWLGLYAVARLSSWNLRPALSWIRGLRWVDGELASFSSSSISPIIIAFCGPSPWAHSALG